ncbi:hypothetical protein, partial [Streptomyces sp. NPDC051997]|uniref:hypothetical protein n=1 Tax=Streptomyces sp. NPDC051997 TaxID=3155611 RepID=UPI0034453ECE
PRMRRADIEVPNHPVDMDSASLCLRQPNTRSARFARPRAKSIPPPAAVYEFALRAKFINLRASGTK